MKPDNQALESKGLESKPKLGIGRLLGLSFNHLTNL
jgi:hypothetical protein